MNTGLRKKLYRSKWKLILIIFTGYASLVFSQDKVLLFDHLTVDDGLSQNTINGIVKDKYGFMWFGTWSGLCRYDGYKFTVYKTEPNNQHTISHNRIHLVTKDADGNIWILPYDTSILCRYNYETDDFTRFPRGEVKKAIADSLSRTRSIAHLNATSNGTTWHVNRDNLMLFQTNNHTHKQISYDADPLNRWALSDGDVTDVYIDDCNMLWVGTYSGGINKADISSNPFSYDCRSLNADHGLLDNNVRSIFQDNRDNLWIGTRSKGITRIDRKKNKYTNFIHRESNGNSNSLISNQVRKIFVDHLGYVWIGTKNGLDRYDPKNNLFFHYSTKTKSKISNDWVYVIMEDNMLNLWIGTWDGIAKYNRKNDLFYGVDSKLLNLKKPAVRAFIEDRNGDFWLAAQGQGLVHLKRSLTSGFKDSFQVIHHYMNSPETLNTISDNLIYSLCEDESGKIWIGTGNGLDRIDPKNGKFIHFKSMEGIADETIVGLLCDGKGNLWVSHKKGLSRLNTKTHGIKNYSLQNGLQGAEFSENACFRNFRTGEMFFGGTNGLTSFFPDSVKNDDSHFPNIVFTDFKIQNLSVPIRTVFDGRIILTRSITLTNEITIRYQDKVFSIEFAGLHYTNPGGNKYKHMLVGFDKDWISTDAKERFARYSNLEPGNYIFKVMAANSDGVWNPNPAILRIKVLAPWWKTVMFKILMILTTLFLIFLYFYWRIASYRKKEIELTYMVQLRTKELEDKNQELLVEQVLIEEQSETLRLANANLKDQQTRLEEYAEEVQAQNEKLKTGNEQLIEHQARIEGQSEELRAYAENLKEANDLLIEKQTLIQHQSHKLEETNMQLAITNATKDRFFSIIAHDLRNPFHAVTGLSEILLNGYAKFPPEKIEKFLSLINTSSISGNNLLENLLQWSRSQTGRISFKPVNFALGPLVDDTLNLLKADLTRKNITAKNLIEPDMMVTADENMVNTIFRNLISNAIKFTRDRGVITIMGRKEDKFIEVTVSDTGVGITEENRNLLFNIGTNISTKGTSNEEGTGLGLILCKEFIDRHHGKIWVESEFNKGSEFKFTLPLA